MERLPEEEVVLKISICQECDNIVTVSVKHLMGKKDTQKFADEVVKYNLKVIEKKLLKYREESPIFCTCNNDCGC